MSDITYSYRESADGVREVCDCCSYPAPLAEFVRQYHSGAARASSLFCEVCATTEISRIMHGDDAQFMSSDARQMYSVIARLGNLLLDQLQPMRSPPITPIIGIAPKESA
jgi:hypothetical protein